MTSRAAPEETVAPQRTIPEEAGPEELYIGLMSGTSLDGIDAALVAFKSSARLRLVETHFTQFEAELRERINHTAQNNDELCHNQDSALHNELAPVYADACLALLKKAGVEKQSIKAIANHGQTVKHEPKAKPPYSLQLGNGQLIANLTGIKTITQFRQADLNAGGQGAPLMPAFHSAVFGSEGTSFILNIGGIANLTHLGAALIGFDTGPGNVLLDQWIELKQQQRYDHDGAWAASGNIDQALLRELLNDDYFAMPYPKSTGTDYFNISWLEQRYPKLHSIQSEDVQATLLALTVESIAQQFERLCRNHISADLVVYVCGGGAQNSELMAVLTKRLAGARVETTNTLGVPSDWLEAIGFAWLGYCREHGIASNAPSVTGARSKLVLGEVFLPA